MEPQNLFISLGKLLICSIAFFIGMILGAIVAQMLRLPIPAMPVGTDASTVILYALLTSPVIAFALAILARGLTGSFITRTLVLSFLTWIAYTVNTQLDAWLYMPDSVSLGYMLVDSLVSSMMCGAMVAWLFPSDKKSEGVIATVKKFSSSKSAGAWAWRLALATVAFMPIYYFFGLLVYPFTGEYYRQNMLGLRLVGLELIIPILFVRSLLFLLACLPTIALWQKSARSLFIRLGLALFILVGFVSLVSAYWMPLGVRVPHSLEIMADEFVYAGVLAALLAKGTLSIRREQRSAEQHATI
jgi:hypothetical protein